MPVDIEPRRTRPPSIFESTGPASLTLALSVAEYFELDQDDAHEIAREVGQTVSQWRRRLPHASAFPPGRSTVWRPRLTMTT
ncbi:MAG: hypothetical protein U5K56_20700 [Halioglobus sp.]|nr:hypothetical protein [Halioglobus sp.]